MGGVKEFGAGLGGVESTSFRSGGFRLSDAKGLVPCREQQVHRFAQDDNLNSDDSSDDSSISDAVFLAAQPGRSPVTTHARIVIVMPGADAS